MDFACKANRAWAMDRLRGLGLPDLTPSTPASHAATLRKLEVRTRPNNRLIQIVLDGRVQGQVTECATRRIGPVYAANLLCFVAGGGFSGQLFSCQEHSGQECGLNFAGPSLIRTYLSQLFTLLGSVADLSQLRLRGFLFFLWDGGQLCHM